MRVTYRTQPNRDYWASRWEKVAIDSGALDTGVYPLKYAQMTTGMEPGLILEAGCGAGRILRYYKDLGRRIVGLDFIPSVIARLKEADHDLDLLVGDVTTLSFKNGTFTHVLAFGLYHNLARGIDTALCETFRVLKPGGKLCASFRADNLQTRLVDRIKAAGTARGSQQHFHKVNLTATEVRRMLEQAGFHVAPLLAVQNMPVLYKYRLFRSRDHKDFDENKARREGYRLSPAGRVLQKICITFLPNQFCNLYVAIATRPMGAVTNSSGSAA